MKRLKINDQFSLSAVAHGYWRADSWNYNQEELYELIVKCLELGVTTFDHANIYGGGKSESMFGEVLAKHPELRSQMEIISKCGIVRNPDDKTGLAPSHYNTSYDHIMQSVDESLARLQTEYLDVLLIHRVDHIMDYSETARAFSDLRRQGKVRYFGVSNFLPAQLEAMRSTFPEIIMNQIEVSVDHLEHFKNGTLEKLQTYKMKAMAYSPLAGGRMFVMDNYHTRLREQLERVREQLNAPTIDHVMYAWIMKHPLHIIPIVGSSKLSRIEIAVEACEIELTNRQFYEIYAHSQLERLP